MSSPADPAPLPSNDTTSLRQGYLSTNHKQINILLLSEVGVGKTVLLDLIANTLAARSSDAYTRYHDAANEGDPRGPTSCTRDARVYTFTSTNGVSVRILDTPGFGGGDGGAGDQDRLRQIVTRIHEQVPTIHAVFILIRGTLTRFTCRTDYSLSMITSMLPRQYLDNIALVYTSVASPFSWTFDVRSLPEALSKARYFLLDNPLPLRARLLNQKARKDTPPRALDEEEEEMLRSREADALKSLSIVFDWMNTLTPQAAKDLTSICRTAYALHMNVLQVFSPSSSSPVPVASHHSHEYPWADHVPVQPDESTDFYLGEIARLSKGYGKLSLCGAYKATLLRAVNLLEYDIARGRQYGTLPETLTASQSAVDRLKAQLDVLVRAEQIQK
ncbi:hypothetical protein PsYK624_088130 [Phanerochaete sordida]|uniref:G domain-containing protein n=1 Tax=Phanerochaete sordida TaxID=48140 RepID=A0A9P3GAV8_9APHY|nr:hypothetical protein PsYK624_088130 [Phanerochaete sordida]